MSPAGTTRLTRLADSFPLLESYFSGCGFILSEKDFSAPSPVDDLLVTLRRAGGVDRYRVFVTWIQSGEITGEPGWKVLDLLLTRFYHKIRISGLMEIGRTAAANGGANLATDTLVNRRVGRFNQVMSGSPESGQEGIDRYLQMVGRVPENKELCNLSLQQLAVLAKETDPNLPDRNRLLVFIRFHSDVILRSGVQRQAPSLINPDFVFDRAEENFERILSGYDPEQEFLPYMRTIIDRITSDVLNKESRTVSLDIPSSGRHASEGEEWEEDLPGEVSPSCAADDPWPERNRIADLYTSGSCRLIHDQVLFMTLMLELYLRTSFKPHQKLIFSNGTMFYTGDTTKVLDLESFLEDNIASRLYALWTKTMDRIRFVCEEVDSLPAVARTGECRKYADIVPESLEPFRARLEQRIAEIYEESEYKTLRDRFGKLAIGETVLSSFFPNPGDYKDVQLRIGRWNTRIKNKLNPSLKKDAGKEENMKSTVN